MQWSDVNLAPPIKTLKQFAAAWTLVFGAFACWQWLCRGHVRSAIGLALVATLVGFLGAIRPRMTRPLFVASMILAFPVGWMISQALLACLFYGLLTPLGLFFRIIGRDVLCRRRPVAETYWTQRPRATDPRRYLRQF